MKVGLEVPASPIHTDVLPYSCPIRKRSKYIAGAEDVRTFELPVHMQFTI